jgi:glycine cleavage system H lipoate-binding protein
MTVLLVIATFMVFVLIDYVSRRSAGASDARSVHPLAELPAVEPVWVAGYQLPESLHYHRGHTWARPAGVENVVVGMDDFARRLLGPANEVELPAVGTWLRQGASGFRVRVDGRAADLVSPIEGEVVEVNESVREQPGLATDDPYGRGWLVKVRAVDLPANLRNLLSGRLARRFVEDAREGLDLRLMALSGSVLQDGGEPVADFAKHLPVAEWKRLVGEFLLT